MKCAPLILFLLCGCAAQPAPRMSVSVGRSQMAIFPDVLLQQDAIDKTDFHIVYSPTIGDPSNFDWTLVSTTNLNDWQEEPTTQQGADLVLHKNGRPWLFWRLKGTML